MKLWFLKECCEAATFNLTSKLAHQFYYLRDQTRKTASPSLTKASPTERRTLFWIRWKAEVRIPPLYKFYITIHHTTHPYLRCNLTLAQYKFFKALTSLKRLQTLGVETFKNFTTEIILSGCIVSPPYKGSKKANWYVNGVKIENDSNMRLSSVKIPFLHWIKPWDFNYQNSLNNIFVDFFKELPIVSERQSW